MGAVHGAAGVPVHGRPAFSLEFTHRRAARWQVLPGKIFRRGVPDRTVNALSGLPGLFSRCAGRNPAKAKQVTAELARRIELLRAAGNG